MGVPPEILLPGKPYPFLSPKSCFVTTILEFCCLSFQDKRCIIIDSSHLRRVFGFFFLVEN